MWYLILCLITWFFCMRSLFVFRAIKIVFRFAPIHFRHQITQSMKENNVLGTIKEKVKTTDLGSDKLLDKILIGNFSFSLTDFVIFSANPATWHPTPSATTRHHTDKYKTLVLQLKLESTVFNFDLLNSNLSINANPFH